MREQIIVAVRKYIGAHANLPVTSFSDTSQLKKSPLNLDETGLRFLAKTLNNYAKGINPSASIGLNDLTKEDFTVKDTYEMVIKKVQHEKDIS